MLSILYKTDIYVLPKVEHSFNYMICLYIYILNCSTNTQIYIQFQSNKRVKCNFFLFKCDFLTCMLIVGTYSSLIKKNVGYPNLLFFFLKMLKGLRQFIKKIKSHIWDVYTSHLIFALQVKCLSYTNQNSI